MAAAVKTTKSFKSAARDRAKHSASGGSRDPKRGGAGGLGAWGTALDDIKAQLQDSSNGALDSNDPNFVREEEDSDFFFSSSSFSSSRFSPSPVPRRRFADSAVSLAQFKEAVREGALTFLDVRSEQEFASFLESLHLPLYHQDVPYVLLKLGLQRGSQDLSLLLKLLQSLFSRALLSPHQMAQGFRKASHALSDLLMDAPNALSLFEDALSHATLSGYLEKDAAETIRTRSRRLLKDARLVAVSKQLIRDTILEFFDSADLGELRTSLRELELQNWFGFEVVKQLVSLSCDRDAAARELASRAVAALSGDLLPREDVEHGFAVLLERVEDLVLDVPLLLELLSCFLARGLVDEALSPAFLLRVDLQARDLGNQVLQQTQRLLTLQEDLQEEEEEEEGEDGEEEEDEEGEEEEEGRTGNKTRKLGISERLARVWTHPQSCGVSLNPVSCAGRSNSKAAATLNSSLAEAEAKAEAEEEEERRQSLAARAGLVPVPLPSSSPPPSCSGAADREKKNNNQKQKQKKNSESGSEGEGEGEEGRSWSAVVKEAELRSSQQFPSSSASASAAASLSSASLLSSSPSPAVSFSSSLA